MDVNQLRTAKFRNIECQARDLGMSAGRRKSFDMIPGRDGEISEDHGKAARKYRIEFVCMGEDWKEKYDKLIIAVEDGTEAEFQHPDGYIHAVQAEAAFDFSILSIGEASIIATLVEVSDIRIYAGIDYDALFEELANATSTVSADRLNSVFAAGKAAADAVNSVTSGIKDALNKGKKVAAGVVLGVQAIETLIADIVQYPATVADYFTDLFENITDFSTLNAALARYHTSEIVRTADYASVTDALAKSTQKNTYELNLHCLQESITQMGRLAVDVDYEALDDATAVIAAIAGHIEDTAFACNAEQLGALYDLQAALVSVINDDSQLLPRLKDFVPWRVMSADEIAQYLYQDGSRASEIVARNKIQHSGFISTDQTLKVLEV